MTWLWLAFSLADAALPRPKLSVTLRPNAEIERSFAIDQHAVGRLVVHRWSRDGRARGPVPASFARTVTAEANAWVKRLAKGGRALDLTACEETVVFDGGRKRVPLCLSRVTKQTRDAFLAWYRQTSVSLE